MVQLITNFSNDYVRDTNGLETGWRWIFTPVKSWYVAYGPNGSLPGYFIHSNRIDHYLDLRVLLADSIIAIFLCAALPVMLRRKHILACASIAAGAIFMGAVAWSMLRINSGELTIYVGLALSLACCVLAEICIVRRSFRSQLEALRQSK